MTFEYAQLNETGSYIYPVHFRIADDPEKFDAHKSIRLVAPGFRPDAAPYVTWSPVGGSDGTIVVSDADNNAVFVNQRLGRGDWRGIANPAGRAYSRELKIRKSPYLSSNQSTVRNQG